MSLHDAILHVLQEQDAAMSITDITDKINQQGLCTRRDGAEVCSFQVNSRTYNRNDLFLRDGNMIKMKQPTALKNDKKINP